MILEGNSRGGAKNLALHLLKTENEQVDVHEIRGFVSNDLVEALNEAYAISRGTKARKFLFSLSLNPPKSEKVPTKVFEDAIERVEKKLGLYGLKRAVVFHIKDGRRHCHAVWLRIDTEKMKAVHMSKSKLKLMDVSRDLYKDYGWKMPDGFIRKQERDPNNFTLAEWQQAKRTGQDARTLKSLLRDCWTASSDQASLQLKLKENGFILAKGDRRSFVVLDQNCEVYALARWAGLKTRDVSKRISDKDKLLSVAETKAVIAEQMKSRLLSLKKHHKTAVDSRKLGLQAKLESLHALHQQEKRKLQVLHERRQESELQARQKRYRRGWKGLVDIFSGRRRAVAKQNEKEFYLSIQRDQSEKDNLVFRQLEDTNRVRQRIERLDRFSNRQTETIRSDLEQYREIKYGRQDHFVRKRGRGPSLDR